MNIASENCNKSYLRPKEELPAPIDIEFQDLSYSIKTRKGSKKILNSINGKYYSGDLTAILGPSGSGKTTLLNILAGYLSNGVTGTIKVNTKLREIRKFSKICTYISQEDMLQPLLTVKEAMSIAAALKLRNKDEERKQQKVKDISTTLRLNNCLHTRTENLSGGEKKRLTIALELINNPPVLFLDEPTTGLDSVANRQCIEILRILKNQGKTIICTIHQPSPAIFNQFDSVYFITNGMCIYNGSPQNMIQYLNDMGFTCPTACSPEEYAIEISQTHQEYISHLVTATSNGKISRRNNKSSHQLSEIVLRDDAKEEMAMERTEWAPFWTQFYILLARMMLQQTRNKTCLYVQSSHHIFSALLMGLLFLKVGNNSDLVMSNVGFCGVTMIFFVYTYVSQFVLVFPMEIEILKREYYNRWYHLSAYYLALSLRNIPVMVLLGIVFVTICYVLTGQPLELRRFLSFCLIGILVAVASEGLGIAIGSIFNVKHGAIVAPAVVATFLGLSIFAIGEGSNHNIFIKVLIHLSYLRYAVVSLCVSIYKDRSSLECNDVYCHLSDPEVLLKYLGMADASYALNTIGLCCFLVLFRVLGFLALKFRLTREFSSPLFNYVVNYIRVIVRYK